jgi:hypothetical protein
MLWIVVAAAAAGSGCEHSPGKPETALQAPAPASPPTRVTGEYLVTLATGADAKTITAVYGHLGIKRTQDLGRNVFLVTLAEDPGPATMEELRGRDARIQAVQPNFVYGGSADRPSTITLPPAQKGSPEPKPPAGGGRQ